MAWTGDTGYLIYVPVGQEPSTGQLIYGGLRPRGSGTKQEDILASSIGKPVLDRELPAFLSDEHTFYIWYDGKADGWSFVPPEFVGDLRMRALAKKNDAAVRTRATNDEIKKMLLESSQKLTSYRKQITDIQSKLAAALVEAQKAGAFQEKLQLLRNVLSVAQFVAQAQAEIPGAGVIDGDNLLTIDRKVSEYRKEQDGIILRRREQMSVQIQLTNEEAAKLRPLLQQSGAPREIIDWTL